MKNIKKIVLYSEEFNPKEEVISFAKSLGYDNIKDLKCRMDENFINFIKNYIEKHTHHESNKENLMSKKNNHLDGFAYINTIDTNRKWCIMHNEKRDSSLNKSYEKIVYVNIYQQELNNVQINLY